MSALIVPGRAVYVLGAGASRDAGYPVVRDFLDTNYIAEIFVNLKDPYYDDIRSKWETRLVKECRYFAQWGRNAEELFTEFLDEGDDEHYSRLRTYMAALLYIARERAIDLHISHYTRVFINRLFLHETATIISFNYDLLIDHALKEVEYKIRKSRPDVPASFNYGFEGSKVRRRPNDPEDLYFLPTGVVLPPYDGRMYYLKLHGSLNWANCAKCSTTTILPTEVLTFDRHEIGGPFVCQGCGCTEVFPLIVPPSKEKKIETLKVLWLKAEEFLDKADYVLFIGYSLPEYDVDAYRLFRTTCSHFAIHSKTVVVVDKFMTQAMQRRFKKINENAEFEKVAFSEWIQT